MALEAVVFQQDHFTNCSLKELCGYDFSNWLLEYCDEGTKGFEDCGVDLKKEEAAAAVDRKKRRRGKSRKSSKNKEEAENQRMTHIAVERNRRKLMNDYLAVLRSLMPPAYAQRGDQASIVGGAINFVKELEQLLQSLEAQRRTKLMRDSDKAHSSPFKDFFAFPQYSSDSSNTINNASIDIATTNNSNDNALEAQVKNNSAVADIEVSMIESHANLKVLLPRRPKQIHRMVAGLQDLRFAVLHLNVTATDQMVLYSFSLKVEDDCQFRSVDEIAAAVHQMVVKIQEESVCN